MIPVAILSAFGEKFLGLFLKHPWKMLFFGALVYIFFIDSCLNPPIECDPCPKYDTVFIKGDSIPYPDTVYVPKHFHHYRDTGSIVEIPADIDSLEIALAYFTEWEIIDTILYDTNGIVIVSDILRENRIQSRNVYKVFYPTYIRVTKTITTKEPLRNILYVGAGVNGWEDKFGASVKVSLLNKQMRMYTLSYDPINTTVEVAIQFPIRFKK